MVAICLDSPRLADGVTSNALIKEHFGGAKLGMAISCPCLCCLSQDCRVSLPCQPLVELCRVCTLLGVFGLLQHVLGIYRVVQRKSCWLEQSESSPCMTCVHSRDDHGRYRVLQGPFKFAVQLTGGPRRSCSCKQIVLGTTSGPRRAPSVCTLRVCRLTLDFAREPGGLCVVIQGAPSTEPAPLEGERSPQPLCGETPHLGVTATVGP